MYRTNSTRDEKPAHDGGYGMIAGSEEKMQQVVGKQSPSVASGRGVFGHIGKTIDKTVSVFIVSE
jgi:hypothetical protein